MARAKHRGDAEHVSRGRASAERADIRLLDRGAIGHRIGEGHAELDHVRTASDERVQICRSVAIACGKEADQGGMGLGEG